MLCFPICDFRLCSRRWWGRRGQGLAPLADLLILKNSFSSFCIFVICLFCLSAMYCLPVMSFEFHVILFIELPHLCNNCFKSAIWPYGSDFVLNLEKLSSHLYL